MEIKMIFLKTVESDRYLFIWLSNIYYIISQVVLVSLFLKKKKKKPLKLSNKVVFNFYIAVFYVVSYLKINYIAVLEY